MKPLLSIAVNTFRESIRNKVLYNIVLVALGVILFSISLGDWSVFARVQVMQDFGLATMSITGLLLSVFIGVGLLGREISSKTAYLVVSKPVCRSEFIVGKFLGLMATLAINFGVLSLFFWAVISLMGGHAQKAVLWAVVLAGVEMAVMVAASIFFSTFSSPTLAAGFTLGFYVAGHLNDLVSVELLKGTQVVIAWLLKLVYYVIPNLEHFNVRAPVVYGMPLPEGYVLYGCVYGALYVGLLLALSCIIFARRDL